MKKINFVIDVISVDHFQRARFEDFGGARGNDNADDKFGTRQHSANSLDI